MSVADSAEEDITLSDGSECAVVVVVVIGCRHKIDVPVADSRCCLIAAAVASEHVRDLRNQRTCQQANRSHYS